MTTEIRIPRGLYEAVLADLRRPHDFAFERVGFLKGRLCSPQRDQRLILLHDYRPVSDEHYRPDDTVGANIGEAAMSTAMKAAFDGRATCDGVFHVHLHDEDGFTGMSRVDARELPKLPPGFASIGKTAVHGVVILSKNHGSAWEYSTDEKRLVEVPRIVVVGAPLAIFDKRRLW